MSKPVSGKKVADWTLEFFRQRNRNHVHNLVIASMRKFDVTQAELARRLGRRPDVVCRWIGAPGNWTLDTVSDLLFAINGLEVAYQTADPLNESKRNFSSPEWSMIPSAGGKTVSSATILSPSINSDSAEQGALSNGACLASATNSPLVTSFSISSKSKRLEVAR